MVSNADGLAKLCNDLSDCTAGWLSAQFTLGGLVGVTITLFTASLAGFAMAQLPDRPRQALVLTAVLVMMAPSSGMWLARFVIFKELGLIDSYGTLVAPALMGTNASFVLLFYWTFRRVPLELFEAARLDGTGAERCWAQLGLPLARPTLVAVGILTFVHYWSDFVDPLLFLKSESRYTLAIGLRILQQLDITNWPLLMAGATLMTVPTPSAWPKQPRIKRPHGLSLSTLTRSRGRRSWPRRGVRCPP